MENRALALPPEGEEADRREPGDTDEAALEDEEMPEEEEDGAGEDWDDEEAPADEEIPGEEEDDAGSRNRTSISSYMRVLHGPGGGLLGAEREAQLGWALLAHRTEACERLCGWLGKSDWLLEEAAERVRRDEAAERVAQKERAIARERAKECRLDPWSEPGDYLAAVLGEILSERQLGYFRLFGMKTAERDFNLMYRGNLRLVVSTAKRFKRLNVRTEFVDLIQAGNIGLMFAVARFDQRLGFKFSTFAIWWIKHHMRRFAMEKHRLIAVPIHLQEKLCRIRAISRRRGAEGLDETAVREAYDLSADRQDRIDAAVTNIAAVQEAMAGPMSLDRGACAEQGEYGLMDVLPDPQAPDPEALMLKAADKETVARLVSRVLRPVEERVLRLRFDLGGTGANAMTLDEIGKIDGLTRERIRQIQEKALRKLQKHVSRFGL